MTCLNAAICEPLCSPPPSCRPSQPWKQALQSRWSPGFVIKTFTRKHDTSRTQPKDYCNHFGRKMLFLGCKTNVFQCFTSNSHSSGRTVRYNIMIDCTLLISILQYPFKLRVLTAVWERQLLFKVSARKLNFPNCS